MPFTGSDTAFEIHNADKNLGSFTYEITVCAWILYLDYVAKDD